MVACSVRAFQYESCFPIVGNKEGYYTIGKKVKID